MKTPLPRRHFLRQAACAGMGAAPLINTLLNLRLAGSVAAAAPGVNDYRALVCLFLPEDGNYLLQQISQNFHETEKNAVLCFIAK